LPTDTAPKLSSSAIWTWASVGLPLAMIGYPVGIYLPDLYSGEMGVPLAAIGTMLMLARFSDAITDPAMGFASDHLETRFGRRKPWVAAGVPTMLIGIWMLFNPADGVSQWYVLVWYAVMTLGATLVLVPYRAWGAELSSDYDTRTRITSANEVFVILGLIAAAGVPFGISFFYPDGLSSSAVLHGISLVLLVLLPAITGLVLWRIPEPRVDTQAPPLGLRKSFESISKNGLFRLLVLIELLITGGENFRNALSLFFMRDFIGIEVSRIATMYIFYFAVGLAAIPFWTALAKRWGKHRSLAAAMILVSVVSVWIFLLERGDFISFYILFGAKGFCFGAFAYLPRAMLADVVDVDTARTRSARPGSYFAIHGIATKFAGALGTGISLIVLGWVGYVAKKGGDAAGLVNGPTELLWLGTLYAIVPTAMFLIAFVLAWNYPLTRDRHRRLEAAIRRRNTRGAKEGVSEGAQEAVLEDA
jgi:GPH family glycoside/pentoside/hexuronide:cation symporter